MYGDEDKRARIETRPALESKIYGGLGGEWGDGPVAAAEQSNIIQKDHFFFFFCGRVFSLLRRRQKYAKEKQKQKT